MYENANRLREKATSERGAGRWESNPGVMDLPDCGGGMNLSEDEINVGRLTSLECA